MELHVGHPPGNVFGPLEILNTLFKLVVYEYE